MNSSTVNMKCPGEVRCNGQGVCDNWGVGGRGKILDLTDHEIFTTVCGFPPSWKA